MITHDSIHKGYAIKSLVRKQLATCEANGFQELVGEAYHSHSSLTRNMKSREGEKASAKVKGKKMKTAEYDRIFLE